MSSCSSGHAGCIVGRPLQCPNRDQRRLYAQQDEKLRTAQLTVAGGMSPAAPGSARSSGDSYMLAGATPLSWTGVILFGDLHRRLHEYANCKRILGNDEKCHLAHR